MKLITGVGMVSLLFLAACQTTSPDPRIIVRQAKVIDVPAALYNCPAVGNIPNPKSLTDGQVAELLLRLAATNQKCRNSIAAIKKYLEEARRTVE